MTGFRDPCPWKDGDKWYMIVGSGFNKVGGAVLLYTSKDGRNWTRRDDEVGITYGAQCVMFDVGKLPSQMAEQCAPASPSPGTVSGCTSISRVAPRSPPE